MKSKVSNIKCRDLKDRWRKNTEDGNTISRVKRVNSKKTKITRQIQEKFKRQEGILSIKFKNSH